MIRIFWTVPQEFPEKRREIFKRADRILRETGDSVYLSPEGKRVTTGEIGHFNKGSFHLATSLHAPIVPIYFAIPREINPGMGYDAKPGTIDVYFLPPIDTSAGGSPISSAIATASAICSCVCTTRCARRVGCPILSRSATERRAVEALA